MLTFAGSRDADLGLGLLLPNTADKECNTMNRKVQRGLLCLFEFCVYFLYCKLKQNAWVTIFSKKEKVGVGGQEYFAGEK